MSPYFVINKLTKMLFFMAKNAFSSPFIVGPFPIFRREKRYIR